MATTAVSRIVKQSTRIPTKLRLTVTSLDSSDDFSESCETVSVNAQGCALHSAKQIAVGTRLTLRLQNGEEATGKVAFCKASPTNDRWGLGVTLDKPGNFWGINPCPEDWLNSDAAAIGSSFNKTASVGQSSDFTRADFESANAEFREQIRKEIDTFLSDARQKLSDELQAQKEKTASLETELQDAAAIRESLTAALQSLPETLDRKVVDGAENALEQIDERVKTLTEQSRREAEELQQQLRTVSEELSQHLRESVATSVDKAHQDFMQKADTHAGEKTQEISDTANSLKQNGDEIFTSLQERLVQEFASKQDAIASSQNEVAKETARLGTMVGSAEERMTKLEELSAGLVSDFSGRLEATASDTISQARANMESLLKELGDEQLGSMRTRLESELSPVASHAESLIGDLRSAVDSLSHEREETQARIDSVRQEKEDIQVWFDRQDQAFRKGIVDSMTDAKAQGKIIVQTALDLIQDPIDKLNAEAKKKIDEGMAQQYAAVGEGIRRLRDELSMIQERTADSLRTALHSAAEMPALSAELPAAKPESDSGNEVEKSASRSQSSFAQKLSGLVRGSGGKRD